jgi:hypothetical protein
MNVMEKWRFGKAERPILEEYAYSQENDFFTRRKALHFLNRLRSNM